MASQGIGGGLELEVTAVLVNNCESQRRQETGQVACAEMHFAEILSRQVLTTIDAYFALFDIVKANLCSGNHSCACSHRTFAAS